MTTTALMVIDNPPVAVETIRQQVQAIQVLMRDVMQNKVHYGAIPGCGEKPALLKPGAEKICMMFRLIPHYEVQDNLLPSLHREYKIVCTLKTVDGVYMGQGLGLCSTMESKFRYRGSASEDTGQVVPKEYWERRKTDPDGAQALIGGKGFVTKKLDNGDWHIFSKTGDKEENKDIADTYNTVLKMAKKRALVDATISTTAASDFFTQDIDETLPETSYEQVKVETKAEISRPFVYDATKFGALELPPEEKQALWKLVKETCDGINDGKGFVRTSKPVPGWEEFLVGAEPDVEPTPKKRKAKKEE